MYALIVIFSIFSDETTWVFLGIANKIFTTRYGVTKYQVSQILSFQFFAQIGLRPLVGYWADKKGHRQYFLMAHAVLYLVMGAVFILWPGCGQSQPCVVPVI